MVRTRKSKAKVARHERRADIERALALGVPLRELEASYGINKSRGGASV